MSMFMPEQPQSAVQQTDFKPVVETPTLDGDIALMQRIFSAAVTNPSQIPSDFLAYLVDFIQTQRLNIPIGQVIGFTGFTPQTAVSVGLATSESTTSASFVDLTHAGPTLDGMAAGRYLLLFGALGQGPAASAGYMAPSVNSATPSTSEALIFPATATLVPGAYAVTKDLADGNNQINMQYASGSAGAAATFQDRWLIAIKYANL